MERTLLLWAGYSIAWVVFVASMDHVLARWRRRRDGADAGRPRLPERAWMSAVFFSLALLLPPDRYGRESARWIFVVVLGVLAIVLALRVLGRRREAARRKREIDNLARRFGHRAGPPSG